MVSLILKLWFNVVLLASVTNADLEELSTRLNEMASNKELIEEMFKPMRNGFIKRGSYGFVFKGERVEDKWPIALKFSEMQYKNKTDHEFIIYTYLNAINNTNVEKYGISPIFYYEEWEGYMLTVFSLFDGGDLVDASKRRHFYFTNQTINSLILFRNFVLQSKYMHSCGVRHDDIKPANIMIRKSRTFLIDFNLSAKMNENRRGYTQQYASRNFHKKLLRTSFDDWESFLYTMCYMNRIRLEWLPIGNVNDSVRSNNKKTKSCRKMKEKINETISKIERAVITNVLKGIFLAFAEEVFGNQNSVPRYDHVYALINAAIGKLVKPNKPALFTWIERKDMQAAKLDLNKNSIDIDSIVDPPDNFDSFPYPEFHLGFFTELKEEMKIKRAENSRNKSILSCFVNKCN